MSARDADLKGPHGWLNWQAWRLGLPARSRSSTSDILLQPLWEEYGLYSDARFIGELGFGPYEFMLSFPPFRAQLGRSQLQLVLRVHDHLLDPDVSLVKEGDVDAYAGGNIGDEFASLLSLALSRRIRSGGLTRRALEGDEYGKPFLGQHHPPMLVPPYGATMLPQTAEEARLDDANRLLEKYGVLAGQDAVALLRAAHQYADALWWADADPRIAWIKLFGALEAAADRWDTVVLSDPIDQLRRRHRGLVSRLEKKTPEALPVVANSLSRVIGAESKLIDFVLAFQPDPPERRPPLGRVDWADLESVLTRLYGHRSRDLHGGIPFPSPLCEPTVDSGGEPPAEAFPALGASGGGGSWLASEMPMYLHTFAYLVGGTLRAWWASLEPGPALPAQVPSEAEGGPDGWIRDRIRAVVGEAVATARRWRAG